MEYSTLIRTNGKDTVEVIRDVINKTEISDINQKIFLYAPSLLSLPTDIATKVKVIPANKVVLKDILMVLLSMDTIRSTDMLDNLPDDIVFIVPDCDRYLKFIGIELIQSVLNQLVYQGARMFFLSENCSSNKDTIVNRLEFEKEIDL